MPSKCREGENEADVGLYGAHCFCRCKVIQLSELQNLAIRIHRRAATSKFEGKIIPVYRIFKKVSLQAILKSKHRNDFAGKLINPNSANTLGAGTSANLAICSSLNALPRHTRSHCGATTTKNAAA